MKTIRKSDWIVGIALSCSLVFASTCSAQIDLNNLPADILNCEVCRHRLGLPPLSSMPIPVVPWNEVVSPNSATPATPLSSANIMLLPAPKSAPARTLGSPGINPSGQAEQLNIQIKQMQAEWKKQIEKAEAANREAMTMLENRTAAVAELELRLKSQQEAYAKLEAQLKDAKEKHSDSTKPENEKLERSKGKRKKPAKQA